MRYPFVRKNLAGVIISEDLRYPPVVSLLARLVIPAGDWESPDSEGVFDTSGILA